MTHPDGSLEALLAVLLVGAVALRSGLVEFNGTKCQVDTRSDCSLGLWQLVLPGVLHRTTHHENVAVVQLDGHRL